MPLASLSKTPEAMKRRWYICAALVLILVTALTWHYLSPRPSPWRETGHLLWPRYEHMTLLLQDGRVLVFGGISAKEKPVLDCEIFDPKTERWAAAGKLSTAPDSGVVLPNGQVLVTECTEDGDHCELFDPQKGTWSKPAHPNSPSAAINFFIPLPDGRILGYFAEGNSSIYDPGTGKWKDAGDSEMACTGVCLPDGRVLVICGENISGAPSHLFDPKKETWTDLPEHTFSPYGQAFLLRNEQVFYLDTVGLDVSILDVKTLTWRAGGTARLYSDTVFEPTPDADDWEMTTGVSLTLLNSGRVLVTGGEYDVWDPLAVGPPISWDLSAWWEAVRGASRRNVVADCEVFDPTTEKWSHIPPLRKARRDHTMTVLKDGSVLVVGGELDVNHPVGMDSCEIGKAE